MTTLLYFEEYESNLSHVLLNRKDINPIIIRTNKNMKFFNESYLESTKNVLNYVIDYYNDIDDEVLKFKNWLKDNDIKIDYFLNDSEYYLEFSNRFARKLGLYALTDEQICWVRDKVDMKKRFRGIGLDTVDFKEINSKDELKKFFIGNGSKRIIFKPRRGMNSIETYMINTLEDIDGLEIDIIPGKYMAEDFCYDHEWSIESLVQRLSEVRAGRANPAILNKVKIDYYGTPTPINQVAGISVPEARMIMIQPWDVSILKEIEKAILASEIGINPNNDGKVIRLVFPELTEERRKDLVKEIKNMLKMQKFL